MKKRSIPAWDLARNASQILFGVVAALTVLLLLFLAFFVARTITSKLVSKQEPPSVSQELPPLPVSIGKPRKGEVVSGLVPVTLVNPSGRNYQRLEFWVDKKMEKKFDAVGANLSDKLYEVNYSLDSRKYADGKHVLTVMAIDMEGMYQSFGVEVNFANQKTAKLP